VDDLAADRFRIEKRLRLDGFVTLGAADGREALDLGRRWLPDVMLLDLRLGAMSGLDVLRERVDDEALSGIPVIVISSVGDSETRRECLALGAAECLVKPVDLDALGRLVGRQLWSKRSSRRRGARRRSG
jgi:CheY-like chemotaxis protein